VIYFRLSVSLLTEWRLVKKFFATWQFSDAILASSVAGEKIDSKQRRQQCLLIPNEISMGESHVQEKLVTRACRRADLHNGWRRADLGEVQGGKRYRARDESESGCNQARRR